jgi:nucleoid DNA-binding protein
MTKLTLTDVVNGVAAETGAKKGAIKDILTTAFVFISTTVQNKDEVRVHEFGTFKLKERAARAGRNPATGEPMEIQASSAIGFKPVKKAK